MRGASELRADADPTVLATATLASTQGGLVLTQTRRAPAPAADGARRGADLFYVRLPRERSDLTLCGPASGGRPPTGHASW